MKDNIEKRQLKGERKFKLSLSSEQKLVKDIILTNKITVVTGNPGCGKTLLSCQIALDGFSKKEYNKIILARPAIEAGENLGFLPGDKDSKLEPYMQPLLDNLKQLEEPTLIDKMILDGKIKFSPIAYLRGITFTDSIVIIDEAQNTSVEQMFMIVTRLGKGSKLIINGDLKQKDIKGESGLSKLITTISTGKIKNISHENLTSQYRDDIVQDIINNW